MEKMKEREGGEEGGGGQSEKNSKERPRRGTEKERCA